MWLGPVSEEKIFKMGLIALQLIIGEESLLDLPRYPNGRHRILREGYMLRLLKAEAQLGNSMNADIACAQPDLKYLNLMQILKLRVIHIDFTLTSATQSQEAFIRSLDNRLTSALKEHLGLKTADPMILRHFVLVFGAQIYIEDLFQEDKKEPSTWLINLPPFRRFVNTLNGEISETGPENVRTYMSFLYNDKYQNNYRVWKWQVIDVDDGGENFTEDCSAYEDNKLAHTIGMEAAAEAKKLLRKQSQICGYI